MWGSLLYIPWAGPLQLPSWPRGRNFLAMLPLLVTVLVLMQWWKPSAEVVSWGSEKTNLPMTELWIRMNKQLVQLLNTLLKGVEGKKKKIYKNFAILLENSGKKNVKGMRLIISGYNQKPFWLSNMYLPMVFYRQWLHKLSGTGNNYSSGKNAVSRGGFLELSLFL